MNFQYVANCTVEISVRILVAWKTRCEIIKILEDKICVLFRYTPKTNIELDTIAKNNPYFYDHKELHINGELYDEYIYVIPPENKITIDEIINGYAYGITYKNKAKIIAFWNDFNSKHIEELLRSDLEIDFGKTKSLHELKEFVPEEDYIDQRHL